MKKKSKTNNSSDENSSATAPVSMPHPGMDSVMKSKPPLAKTEEEIESDKMKIAETLASKKKNEEYDGRQKEILSQQREINNSGTVPSGKNKSKSIKNRKNEDPDDMS